MALARRKDLCIDANEPGRMADFWGQVLGLEIECLDDGDVCRRGARPEQTVWVNAVPEPKTVKNRIHWDVVAPDVEELLRRGATLLAEPAADTPWHVLADPQGNEFCAFAPR